MDVVATGGSDEKLEVVRGQALGEGRCGGQNLPRRVFVGWCTMVVVSGICRVVAESGGQRIVDGYQGGCLVVVWWLPVVG